MHFLILQKRDSLERVVQADKEEVEKNDTTTPEEDQKWLTNWSLTKLFFYNHFPKLLFIVVVLISFIEEDVMSYVLYIFFLVFFLVFLHIQISSFVSIRSQPRWRNIYKWYVIPASIFILARFIAQFSWNDNIVSENGVKLVANTTETIVLTLL